MPVGESRGQPALGLELLEVGLHHIAAAGRSSSGHVVPGRLQQPRPRALAGFERGRQLALAVEAMLDVLVDLGRRVGDPGSVARESSTVARAQALERVEVGGQRAAVGRDEGRALAEDEIAAEADVAQKEEDVVVAVPGRGHDLERAHASGPFATVMATAGAGLARGLVTGSDLAEQQGPQPARRRSGRACEWVSRTPAMPPRSSPASRTASRCALVGRPRVDHVGGVPARRR